ncbi:hypothetical protein B0J18DRAFT_293457 [Chaetomium sp. MPI-SDFR-AT-0129]|nr:hypothetical protein B0J18DRAFT_293457 [Chaetomium sp. MPI-SDFR-AT-0129]
MSASPAKPDVLLGTTAHLMPVETMKAIIWLGFALCFFGFCARSYIRWVCFRKLLPEDWVMMVALALQLAAAIVAQLRLSYVYELEDVSNQIIPMPETFIDDVPKALHGIFIQGILSITGVHLVKLSFLLFFYRLGSAITQYRIFWRCVAFVTLASYAISIALIEYKCMLSDLQVIFFECTANGETARQWTYMVAYCTIDAASDVLIVCLPIAILWQVRLSMRKKLILTGIFSLTLFTVAVTIIRGTINVGRVATDGSQTQNIAWAWFWLSIEFITAYLTSCLVSFRMLFVHNEKEKRKNQGEDGVEKGMGNGNNNGLPSPPARKRRSIFHLESLLDTFHDWEGTTRAGSDRAFLNDALPSGRMSVDFMQYDSSDLVDGVYRSPHSQNQNEADDHHHNPPPYWGASEHTRNGSEATAVAAVDGGGEDERPDSPKPLAEHQVHEVEPVVVHPRQSRRGRVFDAVPGRGTWGGQGWDTTKRGSMGFQFGFDHRGGGR